MKNPQRISILVTSVLHCTGASSRDRQENEIEGITTGREEIKLLTYDRTLFVENPKETSKKLEIKTSTMLQGRSIYSILLYFHIFAVNNPEMKLRKIFIYSSIEKNCKALEAIKSFERN